MCMQCKGLFRCQINGCLKEIDCKQGVSQAVVRPPAWAGYSPFEGCSKLAGTSPAKSNNVSKQVPYGTS